MYQDNSGLQHDSYEAACRYYGADTPEDCAAEAAYYAQEEWIEVQDAIEARGGPVVGTCRDLTLIEDWPF